MIEEAIDECDETMKSKEDVTPERIKSMLDAFQSFGVSREQIEQFFGRSMDAMTPRGMVKLRKIFNSLKDGVADVSDFFRPVIDSSDASTVSERLPQPKKKATKKTTKKAAKKTAKKAAEEVAESEVPEVVAKAEEEPPQPVVNAFAEYEGRVFATNDVSQLQQIRDDMSNDRDLSDDQRSELEAMIAEKVTG